MTEGAGAQAREDSHSTSGGGAGGVAGRAVPIDRSIGAVHPKLASTEDVAAFEKIPYSERIAAASTYDAIRLGASVNPNAPAIQFLPNASHEDEPVVITYAQLIARVTQTANALNELGVGANDVVSFMLPLVPQAFFTLFGAEAAGIANPVNPLLEPHQIAEILEAANTKVLVALGPVPGVDIWDKVMKVRGRAEKPEGHHPGRRPRRRGERHLCVRRAGGEAAARPPAQRPHDQGGRHRRLFPHGRHDRHAEAGAPHARQSGLPGLGLQSHAEERAGLEHPVRHAAVPCRRLADPGVVDVRRRRLPRRPLAGRLAQSEFAVRNIWPLVQRYRPQVLGSVPTVLAATLAVPTDGFDLSSLKIASGGGSAIPVAVCTALTKRHNVPVLEVYGMTETSSVHTISYADRPVRLGSVGHPVPYSRVRIVKIDADGNYAGDCAPNEIGVVAMAGPGVFSGYMMDEHNKGAFVEPGWVNSGDLGRLDEDGYLWITGRAKDLVIRGGHNIDPAPIEDVLFAHPAVALAAVIGQPDAYAGELPLAYVQLNPGATVQPGELEDWVRERTPERAAVPSRHPARSHAAHRRRQGVQAQPEMGRLAACVREGADAAEGKGRGATTCPSARTARTAPSPP